MNNSCPRIAFLPFKDIELRQRGSEAKRLKYRPSRIGREHAGFLIDEKLWKWVKISATQRGTTISTFMESLLLMFKDQESEWKGALGTYIDSLLEEENESEKPRKKTK